MPFAPTPMNPRFTCFWLSVLAAGVCIDFVCNVSTNFLSPSIAIAQTVEDKTSEVERLQKQSIQQYESDRYQDAIKSLNTALEISQNSDNSVEQANTFYHLGEAYFYYGQYFQAIDYYKKALKLYQAQENKIQEAKTLTGIGNAYYLLGEDIKAIQTLELALVIYDEVEQPFDKAIALRTIGTVYDSIGNFYEAIEYLQASFAIYQPSVNQLSPQQQFDFADTLYRLGVTYFKASEYDKSETLLNSALSNYQKFPKNTLSKQYKIASINRFLFHTYRFTDRKEKEKDILILAMESSQSALTLSRKVGNRAIEAAISLQMGVLFLSSNDYSNSINSLQKSLEVYTQLSYRNWQANVLSVSANVYLAFGQNQKAIESLQQALTIYQETGDLYQIAYILSKLANATSSYLNQYQLALSYYEEAFKTYQLLEKSNIEKYYNISLKYVNIYNEIGTIYASLGKTEKAIENYHKALEIYQEFSDDRDMLAEHRMAFVEILNNIGKSYKVLAQYPKALDYFNRGLEVVENIPIQDFFVKTTKLDILNQLLYIYKILNQTEKANQIQAERAKIEQEISDGTGNLDNFQPPWLVAYEFFKKADDLIKTKQYEQALELYQKALEILQETEANKELEYITLSKIGSLYEEQQQYILARQYFARSLLIARETDNRSGEHLALGLMAQVFKKENQPELAIIFWKQTVNVIETIRQDLKNLPQEQQESYLQTNRPFYEELAKLLLEQDRIYEAQRVLDLLKVQEINDYTRGVRGNENTSKGIPLTRQEQTLVTSYENLVNQAVSLGKELDQLKKNKDLTQDQIRRINEIQQAQIQLNENFNNFINTPEVVAAIKNTNIGTQDADFINELSRLNRLPNKLKKLNAVLIYPLILDDRIELIITTPYSPPTRHTVKVSKKELNEAILKFRQALQDPNSDPKPIAKQLYQWLIQPLEQDLKTAEIKTIIYAPDGQLRYIPLAALYDGKQWLIERYQVNNITAMSLTDFDDEPTEDLQILAGAFSQGNYNFNIGQESFNFAGLPFAGKEVANLGDMIPNTIQLLNNDFSKDNTTAKMTQANVVHLATHAAIVVGQTEDSFILFGNGERVTLKEVENWQFDNIDLIVFSACETGLGGNLGDGKEILGFGYLIKAKASIASLWSVSDGGTQALMTGFYAALQISKTTKVEALQKAQIALITGNYEALGEQRGLAVRERISKDVPSDVSSRLSHPYYWSAFILIGNGL